jgi:hypothetical protein
MGEVFTRLHVIPAMQEKHREEARCLRQPKLKAKPYLGKKTTKILCKK